MNDGMNRVESPTPDVVVSNFRIPDGTELPCSTAGAEVSELNITMEEADARIVPHVMHAVTHGISRIIVLSADTDVFVLMVFYWNVLHSHGLSELWVKAGVGDSTRFIPIHVLAAQIGENLCQVLPAVHVLTGCDYTSKIGTKHAALMTNPEHYLEHFGTKTDQSTIDKAEEYLTQVLKKGTNFKKMDQLHFKKMDQLRNELYHNSKSVSLQQLPPTSSATRLHILRAVYATNEMVSLLSTTHDRLDPTQYGFEEVDDLLTPKMHANPIPEKFATHCHCLKCGTQRCPCLRNAEPCCSFCRCQSGLVAECKKVFGKT